MSKTNRATLAVKTSQLPGAGKGLFARTDFRKGDEITEYKGRRRKWSEVKHLDGENGYLMRVNATSAIDARPYSASYGRFANDATGSSRSARLRNNAEYVARGLRVFIEATRTIRNGEEIFVGYGREYWTLMKKIAKRTKITERNSSPG